MAKATLYLVLGLLLVSAIAGAAELPLIQADKPVSVAVAFGADSVRIEIEAKEACTVTVQCPIIPATIRFTGLTQPLNVVYDKRSKTLQLGLQPGKLTLLVRSP